jgi:hypothetical protein
MFSVSTRGNNGVAVHVPKTFVAINLTEQVSKQYLLDSENFRRAVGRGGITLIDSATAARINNAEGASEEVERVRNITQHVGVMESQQTLTGKTDASRIGVGIDKRGVTVVDPRNQSETEERVSAKVLAIVSDTAEGEMGIINRLRSIREELTAIDANYIIREGRARKLKKLEKSGRAILAQLTDDDEDDEE